LFAQDVRNFTGLGVARRSAVTVLYINVRRNINPPIFTNANTLTKAIDAATPIDSFIVTLLANDADENVGGLCKV